MYFGQNNPMYGYSDLTDLNCLVKAFGQLLPGGSTDIRQQIDRTVLYRVGGPNTQEAVGISIFYPYSGFVSPKYIQTSIGSYNYSMLMDYVASGVLSGDALSYAENLPPEMLHQRDDCDLYATITVDTVDLFPCLQVPPESLQYLDSVEFQCTHMKGDDQKYNLIEWNLGPLADEKVWETGNFMMPISFGYQLEGHTIYVRELKTEGTVKRLQTYLMVDGTAWEITLCNHDDSGIFEVESGRTLAMDGSFRPTSQELSLEVGSVIRPLFYKGGGYSIVGEMPLVAGDSFILQGPFILQLNQPLGNYCLFAMVHDKAGRSYLSSMVYYCMKPDGGAAYWYDEPGFPVQLWDEEDITPVEDGYIFRQGSIELTTDAAALGYLTAEDEKTARAWLENGEIEPWQYFRYRDPAVFEQAVRYVEASFFADEMLYLFEEYMDRGWWSRYGFDSRQAFTDACDAEIASGKPDPMFLFNR